MPENPEDTPAWVAETDDALTVPFLDFVPCTVTLSPG